jgi:hypothetical protein
MLFDDIQSKRPKRESAASDSIVVEISSPEVEKKVRRRESRSTVNSDASSPEIRSAYFTPKTTAGIFRAVQVDSGSRNLNPDKTGGDSMEEPAREVEVLSPTERVAVKDDVSAQQVAWVCCHPYCINKATS